jgi:uncharacterized protein (TIGR02217 family)
MAFHEDAIFPTRISAGSRRALRFNTAIVKHDGGSETRFPRYTQPLLRFTIDDNLRSQQDAYDLVEFFWARQGATYGFRFRDWGDYATTGSGTTAAGEAVTATDAIPVRISDDDTGGVGDGSSTQFRLAKQYTSGTTVRWRNITKPDASTVLVSLDGVLQSSGYTLDDTTGIVTFSSAPGAGVALRWGGEFYVPCRFSADTDNDGLVSSAEDWDANTFSQVVIEEIRGDIAIAEVPNPGGSATFDPMTADVQLGIGTGRAILVDPDQAGRSLLLPGTLGLGAGIGHFYIKNLSASYTVAIRYAGSLVHTIATSSYAEVGLVKNSAGAYEWVVFS